MSRQLIPLIVAICLAGLVSTTLGGLNDPNLVAWWSFDDGSGSTATDAGPLAMDGALHSGAEWRTEGIRNGCLFFDGADDYVLVPSRPALNPGTGSFTITFWANVDQTAGTSGDTTWDLAVGKRDSGSDGYYVGAQRTQGAADETGYRFMLGDTGAARLDTPFALVRLGEWVFVTAVLDRAANEHRISVDGGQTWATATPPIGPIAPDQDLSLGWDVGMDNYSFHGLIDEVAFFNRALSDVELGWLMDGGVVLEIATGPAPENRATDVVQTATLSWTSGQNISAHDVYFGTSFDDVSHASRDVPLGVLVSQGQQANAYDPGYLEYGRTYYWRVDEVGAAPSHTVYRGNVWTFTVEPMGYPIQGVQVTSNGTDEIGQGLDNIVNGSGLDADGLHSNNAEDIWLASPADDGTLVVQFEFDGVYKLHEMLIWNCNVQFISILGFGIQNVTLEYSEDNVNWTVLGDFDLSQGTGLAGYAHNTTIDFGGAAVKYVKLTVNSAFGADVNQYGLSEVRFLYIPAYASEPAPADGTTDVVLTTTLSWRAGRGAVAHEVYLGSDPNALPLAATVQDTVYETGDLDLATTYYWQIVEVNDAEAISAWAGPLWSFSTQEYIVIDDFERYNDDITAGETVWQTWIDGFDDTVDNGSQVGHSLSPFAEQTIVHGGSQSMPVLYDNTGMTYAEAKMTFSTPQDWTRHGIAALTLFFRGEMDNQGQLYARINNVKVPWDGNANVITKLSWQAWNIDLSTVGIDLTNVRSVAIGIDGANVKGTLYVDDVRLYRTPPLAPREPDSAHLVAHYAFEGDVTDSSGNGYDGQIMGSPAYVTGVVGQAMEFDGYDDFVQIADDDRLNPGDGDFSISFWAQLDPAAGTSGTTTWDLAVNKRQTSSIGYYVGAYRPQGGVDEAGFKFMLGNPSGTRVDTPYMLVPLGEWAFVTAVLDRAENVHKISVNGGHSWATATPPSGSIVPVRDLAIGFDIGPNNYWFHGKIDEVRLYDIALSNEEAAWLANN